MKKMIIIIAVIAIILILTIPKKYYADDGGTVRYEAILYSVTDYHSFNMSGGYNTGIEIEILGITVYENTTFAKTD